MAHLSVLVAEFGEDVPYVGGLARGFPFRGARVPFLNYQKGIYRAAVQSGPAALPDVLKVALRRRDPRGRFPLRLPRRRDRPARQPGPPRGARPAGAARLLHRDEIRLV